MSGAWESDKSVLVSILTRELVSTAWADGWKKLQIPQGGNYQYLTGGTFDMMRNMGCRAALDLGFEYLFFLDDDTIPPADAIARLVSHKKDIVSGLYYRRHEPLAPVMMRVNAQGGSDFVGDFSWPALIEVDYVGAGCLLIHRRVLEAMKGHGVRPWFEWMSDRTDLPENERRSEDFEFCHRAKRKYGFKIFVDTAVQCRHVGLGKAWINLAAGNKPEFSPIIPVA